MEPQTNAQVNKNRSSASAEAEVRALMDQWADGIRSRDIEKILSCYAPDVVAFDLMPPMKIEGAQEYRKNWEMFEQYTQGAVQYEFVYQKTFVSEDLAIFFAVTHMNFADDKGQTMNVFARYTAGLKKQNGKWMIIHENNSVPVDMETDKAMFDLNPEKNPRH
ncbi:YybH family protein [Bdellovibrio reynosensis]|uniref:SgcJ/EcaC family oxidoreductase n=1 Tax=Bdellovibrio reynosensis TaxID=2835041 RepID=A0ABY4CCG9_9BACT|nr:SgcJ/EcaC family oxidoreductase [Bdellovibrio reynosensis]UOF02538.1 SgcJ/EcaC family oxidoreductase [Bdellovibrio reynosensis]